jgi:hypothetical protein
MAPDKVGPGEPQMSGPGFRLWAVRSHKWSLRGRGRAPLVRMGGRDSDWSWEARQEADVSSSMSFSWGPVLSSASYLDKLDL